MKLLALFKRLCTPRAVRRGGLASRNWYPSEGISTHLDHFRR